MMYKKMYEYYKQQNKFPTYGAFHSEDDLLKYESHRRDLFVKRLYLPTQIFKNAKLMEIGPDTGENSLIFAKWGAMCTLVEPNSNTFPVINQYFDHYKLMDRLVEIIPEDVNSMAKHNEYNNSFDVIDAEGFIHTVKPTKMWVDLFSRLLKDDGILILFYYEKFGCFFELLYKVLYYFVMDLSGMKGKEAAKLLFQSKWDSIPHKRTMDSWVMDVLENPFTRLEFTLEAKSLCESMQQAGLSLYSSWPPYKNGLDVSWFKKPVINQEQIESQNEFIMRNRLSHIFGKNLYLINHDVEFEESLSNLIKLTDTLIDEFDLSKVNQCEQYLENIEQRLLNNETIADTEDLKATLLILKSIKNIFKLISQQNIEELIKFCNDDKEFINCWGVPSHFAVFCKT